MQGHTVRNGMGARSGVAVSRRVAASLLALATVASACAGGDGEPDDGRPLVVTTVAPITSIVANIVGNHARVVGVVPEGTNSHTFEPRPSVARVLAEADIIFINGLQLEEPTRKLAEANKAGGVEIVQLADETITPDEYIFDFSFPREEGKPNPHLWTDPLLVKEFASIVAGRMGALDPGNAEQYRSNLEAFSARIDAFDGALRADLATVAPDQRQLLTYHDAYAYFARDYGWKVLGAIQVSDFEDPTPKEVADLIAQVRSSGVTAIFGSEVFPSPVLEQIGKETDVTYVDELRDDDLPGAPGDPAHSWLGLMRFDYVTMIEALGGDASQLRAFDIADVAPDRAEYPQ